MNEEENLFLESKQTEAKSAKETRNLFSCDVCDFTGMSRKDLNIHINRQHKDLEQLDGNISLMNPTYDDSQKPELPTEIAEDVMTLKLDIEYWTWPRGKVPPPKVHHPQEGVVTLPRIYTDALGFDQICYTFKTGVKNVFEIT